MIYIVRIILKLFSCGVQWFCWFCWEQGQTPDLKYLIKNKLYRKQTPFSITQPEVYDSFIDSTVVGYKDAAFVFLQIEVQHYFVERWTVFAGLWFEEIEPLLS